MNEAQLAAVVDAVVKELLAAGAVAPRPAAASLASLPSVDATPLTPMAMPARGPVASTAVKPVPPSAAQDLVIDLPDPATSEARYAPGVKQPKDPEGLQALVAATTARIGVGRAGPRYTTRALLLFQADHAVTQDALYRAVDQRLLDELGLFTVQTKVTGGKQEYLLRPDLGRQLSDAAKRLITEKCTRGPDIQVVVGDGLSAAAIEANLRQMLPVIRQGAQAAGLTLGTPFFVEFCRVGVMNDIGDLLQPQVLILLIGERPGLGRAESMSAYMAYRPKPGDTDADRDVICNIFEGGGTNPLEAGAYAIQLAQKMRRSQASGVKLKLAS
ncbi:MAG: ethanolamine ammonia-lyase subunit EutC [Anaerolineales bacterium]|nr:ethanolamine ammonia-lyase subunit EutC [Anaerolineales bacterium]